MPENFIEYHIRQHPWFENLAPTQIEEVVRAFQVRRYDPNETIYRTGETPRGMRIITDGSALQLQQAPDGSYQRVGTVQAGETINDEVFYDPQPSPFTLMAQSQVTALLLTREALSQVVAYHPDIGEALGFQRGDNFLSDVQFRTQRENEEILLQTRLHPWAYIRWFWIPGLIMVSLWIVAYLMPSWALLWIPLSAIIPGVIGLYLYIEWRNDSVIITDQRVTRITHTILTFTEVRDEVAIESVQETNAVLPPLDPFAVLLRYGHVEIKTAGSAGNFTLLFMPNPEDIQQLLIEGRQHRIEKRQEHEREVMRAELDRWISKGGEQDAPWQQNSPAPSRKQTPDNDAARTDADRMENFWSLSEGPLSPFITRFPTDEGGMVYRKHWIIWLRNVFMPLLWIGAWSVLALMMLFVDFLQALGSVFLVLPGAMILFGIAWFYFVDWDWRHDYYVVSDTNITLVNRRPLWLQSENDQILLKQVDNVVSESSGIIQQVLGFGDVRVSLVGADAPKVFDYVANPVEIQSEISRRQRRMREREQEEQRRAQRESIGEYLSMYHDMSQEGKPQQQSPQGDNGDNRNAPPQPRISQGRPTAPGNRDRNRPPNVPQQAPPQAQQYRAQQGQQQQPPRPQQNRQVQNPSYGQQQNPQPYQQTQNPPQNPQPAQSQQYQQPQNQQYQQRQPNPSMSSARRYEPQQNQNPPQRPQQPPPPPSFPQANRPQTQSNDDPEQPRPPKFPRRNNG